jgi:hypothetical protein
MAFVHTNPWADLEALFGDLALEDADTLATESDAMREYAYTVGAVRCDLAWICTNYDTWVPNPYYDGPEQPHPEDDEAYADLAAWRADRAAARLRAEHAKARTPVATVWSDGVPF